MDCPANSKQLPADVMNGSPPPPHTSPGVAAVVVAAGRGLRAGLERPKQFAHWRGKPVVRHSVEAFHAAGISPIVVVIPEGARDLASACLDAIDGVILVTGDATRQGSVLRGLEALETTRPSRVLIHDAARPALSIAVVDRLCKALETHMGAIPVLPVVDSLVTADSDRMGEPAARENLRRVQTPQAFDFQTILDAHRAWEGARDAGDDAQVARAAGIEVALIEGDEALQKLTFASDFESDAPPVRIGTGFDVHRLESGQSLWLCGVKIEHDKGLAGHSDADVAMHALVDAMLGALGAGDIGKHFPPSDPQWRGARSDRFLAFAVERIAEAGYRVGNADLTIICEAPKIAPHRDAMRKRLSEIMSVDTGVVSVKATTTEKLGFTGREEGIAAQAAVCLVKS